MGKPYPRLRQKGAYYYFDAGGKPRKWIPLGKDWQRVEHQYRRLMAQHAPNAGDYRTVADMLDAYLKHLQDGGAGPSGDPVRPSTLRIYRSWAKHLIKTFGRADPRDLTQKDIDRYMYVCRRTSFDHERSLLSGAYQHAKRTSDIEFNPCLGVKSEKKPARRLRLLTDAELALLREHLRPMLRLTLDLMYMLGLRPVDVCGLRRDQFVEAGADVETQKTGQRQRYIINDELRQVLAEARALQRGRISPYVLTNGQGGPLTVANIWYHFDRARTAAGIKDIRPQDIRPKAGTDMELQAQDGGVSAQRFLGHKTLTTTRLYLRDRAPNVVTPLKRKAS